MAGEVKQLSSDVLVVSEPVDITSSSIPEATESSFGTVLKNRWQIKRLTADRTSTTTNISDLAFNNLVIGRRYRLTTRCYVNIRGTSASEYIEVYPRMGGVDLPNRYVQRIDGDGLGSNKISGGFVENEFICTNASITHRCVIVGSPNTLLGVASGFYETFAMLEELNNNATV